MLFKSTAVFLALLLAMQAQADSTVTHTNYIYPSGLPSAASATNLAVSEGIKVVFVYENGCEKVAPLSNSVYGGSPQSSQSPIYGPDTVPTNSPATGASAASPVYGNAGNTLKTVTTTNGAIVSTLAPVTQSPTLNTMPLNKNTGTSALTTKVPTTTTKRRLTIYEVDTTSEDVEVQKIATASAVTTTTTIFSATTVPSTVFKPSTTVETITETKSNPLVTQSVVSKSLVHSLPTSYSPVTIAELAAYSNSSATGLYSNTTSPLLETTLYSNSSEAQTRLYSNASATHVYSNGTTSAPIPTSTFVVSSYIDVLYTQAKNVSSPIGKYANSSLIANTNSSLNASSSVLLSSYFVSTSRLLVSSTVTSAVVTTSDTVSSTSPTSTTSSTTESSSSSTTTSSSTSSSAASTTASAAKAWNDDNSNEDNSGDLFEAISTSAPLSLFPREPLGLAVPSNVDESKPFGTNKFYANLFLDDQTDTVWPLPYGLFWKKTDYYGFGVTRNIVSQRVFGSLDTNNVGVDSYYLNPIGNAELIISATTLTASNNVMSVSEQEEMSVLVSLSPNNDDNKIEIPIVQGMGFVTAIYSGDLVVELNSLIGITSITAESSSLLALNVLKYRATLFNDAEWLIYVTVPSSKKRSTFSLTASDSFKIVGSGAVDGLIVQTAFTNGSNESFYDKSAGTYVTDASVSGTVSGGTSADFKIQYETVGSSLPVVFALPHHQDVLSSATAGTNTNLQMMSNTKGTMKGYYTSTLEMTETLNPVGYLPSTSTMTSLLLYTADQLTLIAQAANSELAVDIASTVASMGSNYYSGKVIDKYAYILLVVSEVLKDDAVTKTTLAALKDAFDEFFTNKQKYSFFYDTRYKGITTDVGNEGSGADFGSSYYNDHHFHFGYFIHAAAVVGYVDKKQGGTWAEDNKDWVNSLIRDVANPSRSDEYFPVSRSFDWFHGHSWAAGLFASGDGKNEESSSEDYNFAYGMRLWGKLTGDLSMKSRGDLMISIMSRAMNKYFYYQSDNTVEPSEILPNKVSGILFENKIAYTTYFGSPDKNPEYVHGIHMLPITPVSSLVRIPSFVEEEWKDQVSTFIDNVSSGWTGILRLNQALYDAKSSYEFFSSLDWKDTYLDNGQSRTWSLAFSAGVSNAS